MKTCTKCNKLKDLDEFYFKNKLKNIKTSHCKSCDNLRCKKYYSKNTERRKESVYAWRDQNPRRTAAIRANSSSRIDRKTQAAKCDCCSDQERLDFYYNRKIGQEVDHIVPVSKGGLHCVKNFQYLTKDQHTLKTKEDRKP